MAKLQKVFIVGSEGTNFSYDDCLGVTIQTESGVQFLVSAEGTDAIRISSRKLKTVVENVKGESHAVLLSIGDALIVKRA